MRRWIDSLLASGEPEYLAIRPFFNLRDKDEINKEVQGAVEKINEKAKKFASTGVFWATLRTVLESALQAAEKGKSTKASLQLTEASVLINRAEESEAQRNLKIRLAVFPALWMLGFLGLQVLIRFLQSQNLFPHFSPEYFGYLWVGLIGGTSIVLWGIIKHSVELDFDHTYAIWHLLKPGLGAIMGVVAVLVIKAGFLAVEGKIELTNAAPLYLLAFIVGFSERFFIRILDRVITATLGGDSSTSIQNLMLRSAERSLPAAPTAKPNESEDLEKARERPKNQTSRDEPGQEAKPKAKGKTGGPA